jgi:hypothetical protein
LRPGHETRSNPGNCGGVVGRNEVDRQVRGRHGRAGPQTVISVKHPSMFYYGRESMLKMGTQNIRRLGCNTFYGKTGLTKTQTRHIETY